jgi:hypothetical protein
MYASNVVAFLKLLIKDGAVNMNLDDEIIRGTLVTHKNAVVKRARETNCYCLQRLRSNSYGAVTSSTFDRVLSRLVKATAWTA